MVNAAPPSKAGGTRSKLQRQQQQQKPGWARGISRSTVLAGADEDEVDKALEDDVDDKHAKGRGSGRDLEQA